MKKKESVAVRKQNAKVKAYIEFLKERVKTTLDSYNEAVENNTNISKAIFEILEEQGFKIDNKGTVYLKELIALVYHERKSFNPELNEKNEFINSYWDLTNENNDQYYYVKEIFDIGRIKLVEKIKESINDSSVSEENNNTIVYGIANQLITKFDENIEEPTYINLVRKK